MLTMSGNIAKLKMVHITACTIPTQSPILSCSGMLSPSALSLPLVAASHVIVDANVGSSSANEAWVPLPPTSPPGPAPEALAFTCTLRARAWLCCSHRRPGRCAMNPQPCHSVAIFASPNKGTLNMAW